MNRQTLGSVFKDEINAYLDSKVAAGFQERSFKLGLRAFDRFCQQSALCSLSFSRELADKWCKRRKNEASTTHYSRINTVKHFLLYLRQRGYDVHVTRDIAFKQTQFQPYIYTDEETKRYFQAVDAFKSRANKKSALQYPVLFRLLCCCGTRIDETLRIRKKDVDFREGVIKLCETKNDMQRYVVFGDDLRELIERFAYKCFYLLGYEDYIFRSSNGGRCQYNTIYDHHRLFLKTANIPYIRNGEGPRIHDWRHTFAVKSFKQMIDSGMDMYVALPVLSSYLGHKSIYATEGYVRLTMALFPYIEAKFKAKLDEVFGCGDGEQ